MNMKEGEGEERKWERGKRRDLVVSSFSVKVISTANYGGEAKRLIAFERLLLLLDACSGEVVLIPAVAAMQSRFKLASHRPLLFFFSFSSFFLSFDSQTNSIGKVSKPLKMGYLKKSPDCPKFK